MSGYADRRSRTAGVHPSTDGARPSPGKRTLGPESAFGAAVQKREALGAGGILALQAAAGNRAVVRLVQARRERSSTGDNPLVEHVQRSAARGGKVGGETAVHEAAPVPQDSTGHASEQALPAATGGQPMPGDVQARMEHAFGADFSAVRIHEGPHAPSIGALAYTQGTDIHFAPGAYDPGSRRGQSLLGHELTHVVQQAQGRVQSTGQAKGAAVNDDPALEREADDMGARAARGERVRGARPMDAAALPGGSPDIRVQCKPSHGVIQMTKWQWTGQGGWKALGEITSRPPEFPGLYVGQIYDDRVLPPTRIEFGGGNLSFGSSYVDKHPSFAPRFTTTTKETREELRTTYPAQNAMIQDNIDHLEDMGATVSHDVDATEDHGKRDVDHFNFPHTGDIHTSKTSTLLKQYLEKSEETQDEGHIIRIGLLNESGGAFDSRYGLRGALKTSTYHPIKKMVFDEERFPGYSHVKTTGKGKLDFTDQQRMELWLQKTGTRGNPMDIIPNMDMEDGYNSDEERERVYDRNRDQYPHDQRMRHLLEDQPRIEMRPVTLTDNIHSGAFRTFKGAIIRPTGKFDGPAIQVEIVTSYDDELFKGSLLFVKVKHIDKVGREM